MAVFFLAHEFLKNSVFIIFPYLKGMSIVKINIIILFSFLL